MRVFLAGATGALGRRLTPLLLDAGHEVVGTTRSADKAEALRQAGAAPVVLDALDRAAVMKAVVAAAPEVVVHQLTDLSKLRSLRFDQEFTVTNRLRTEGLDHLLAAAREAGVSRFVAQSYTGWPNERTGGWVKTEDDPLDPNPEKEARQTLAAIRHVEQAITSVPGIAGLALRYGGFYGPGTGLGVGGEMLETVRGRKLPVVGGGTGVWSLLHIDDAASATLAAIQRGPAGLYNIVDDDPAPVADILRELAAVLGVKAPRKIPAWLAKPLIGEHGVAMMTQGRGSSNAKAKRELNWQPTYASWREGFRVGLG